MTRCAQFSITILSFVLAVAGHADVTERHREMSGIPNERCLECHTVIRPATGAKAVMPHLAHGIHLDVVENCADCHVSVDLAKTESQPWVSQVDQEVCFQCHRGEITMVQHTLEETVHSNGESELLMKALHNRVPLPVEGDFAGSDMCGGCHEELFEFWEKGPHARAMSSPIFERDWEENKHALACLRCHTTGFDAETGEFAARGVGCEVCHGPMNADHPDATQGVPEAPPGLCANCHLDEWGEWRSSGHADVGIGCDMCHNPHGQELLMESVQELCTGCHGDDVEDFAHSTHATRDLLCSECHMHPEEHGGKTGHTFSVGSGTCLRCHRDEIHTREKIVTLSAEVEELREADEPALRDRILEQETEIEWLKTSRTVRLYTGLLQGSLIGLAVGGVGAWTAARRWREEEESDDDEEA